MGGRGSPFFGDPGVPMHGGYQDATTGSLQTGKVDAILVSVESTIHLASPKALLNPPLSPLAVIAPMHRYNKENDLKCAVDSV